MPLKSNFLPLPQTAADLLEGLLRSQLFAESIFGQIFEQSRPYLTYPAGEYAAALVQRRILTAWQAGELLAGRTNFYWGTYRLLGKLVTTSESALFVAEQPGVQRLVLLEAIPQKQGMGSTIHEAAGQFSGACSTPDDARHPHLARCLQVQTAATQYRVAYEYVEAAWLPAVVSKQPPTQSQCAHLVLQLANTLETLSQEAIEKLNPRRSMIDHDGQLKWLLGPRAWFGAPTTDSSTESGRDESQMNAVREFSQWLGGLPGMSRCRNLSEVVYLLGPMAEAWREAYSRESIAGSRTVLHRMLRKGPSLKQIESLHAERQYAFASEPVLPQLHEASKAEPHAILPVVAFTPVARKPRRDRKHSAAEISATREKKASGLGIVRKQSQRFTPQANTRGETILQSQSRSKQLLLTVGIAVVASGLMVMQWIWRWPVSKAKAHAETTIDSMKSPDRSR